MVACTQVAILASARGLQAEAMAVHPMAIARLVVTHLVVPATARSVPATWTIATMTTAGHSTTTLMEHAPLEALAVVTRGLSEEEAASAEDAQAAALEAAVATSVAEGAKRLRLSTYIL